MNKNSNLYSISSYIITAIIMGFVIPVLTYYFIPEGLLAYIIFGILFFSQEIIASLVMKKVGKKIDKLPVCLTIHELYILITLLLFATKKYDMVPIIGIITLIKLVTWFISRRFITDEKVKFKIVPTVMVVVYTLLLVVGVNLFLPTNFNQDLFIKYGVTTLSSKELHMELIQIYNKKADNKVGYFHQLTSDELSIITKLYIETTLNDKDLEVLKEIKDIHISEKVKISEELNLSKNEKLLAFSYPGVTLKKITFNKNIRKIDIYSTMEEFDIHNSKDIKYLNIESNSVVIKSFDQIKKDQGIDIIFNKLVNEEDKVILGIKSNNTLRIANNKIDVPDKALVEDIYSDVYRVEITNVVTNGIVTTGTIINDYKLSLYDNDTLVLEILLVE